MINQLINYNKSFIEVFGTSKELFGSAEYMYQTEILNSEYETDRISQSYQNYCDLVNSY